MSGVHAWYSNHMFFCPVLRCEIMRPFCHLTLLTWSSQLFLCYYDSKCSFWYLDDNRFLHILLYTAERAWSHAMEKRQLPDGPNRRQRIYLIGRLRKAVKWASLFAQLCAIKGDSRTSLEAEVWYCLYYLWII